MEALNKIAQAYLSTPFFGASLCFVSYWLAAQISKKSHFFLLNPLLVATAIIILFLKGARIPYETFAPGADILQLFLGPVTAVLAISMYNQREILVRNLLPVAAGTLAGSLACVTTILILSRVMNLEEIVKNSILSKSVTTPIALALSSSRGGILPVTVLSVIFTGLTGAIFAPYLVKIFHIKNPAAAGIGIGTCSHALGTSTALRMGEVYGAMSSISIGCAGLATTVIFIFLR